MTSEPTLHIIYLASGMLLSKKPYSGWRPIQDEFGDYKASLGPWSASAVWEFLCDEYASSCHHLTQERLDAFLNSDDEITLDVS